jgi:hypothetical protein
MKKYAIVIFAFRNRAKLVLQDTRNLNARSSPRQYLPRRIHRLIIKANFGVVRANDLRRLYSNTQSSFGDLSGDISQTTTVDRDGVFAVSVPVELSLRAYAAI